MKDKSKYILKATAKALASMNDFQKGYLLGKLEGIVEEKEKAKKEEKNKTIAV